MTRRLLLLFTILIAAPLAWIVLWPFLAGTEPSIDPDPGTAAEATNTEPAAAPEGDPTVSHAREEAHQALTLRGRCIAAEDGTPLSGVEVRAHGWHPVHEERWRSESTTTAADGTFQLPVHAPDGYTLSVRATGEYRLRCIRRVADEESNLGDLQLTLGVRLRGAVRNEAGKSAPYAQIRLRPDGAAPRPEWRRSTVHVQADGNGVFACDERLVPGRWKVEVHGTFALAERLTLDLPTSATERALDLVVWGTGQPGVIRGTIVDEDDGPLPNLRVSGYNSRYFLRGLARTETGPDGRFVLVHRDAWPGEVRLQVATGDAYEPVTPYCSWGDEDVRIVLSKPGHLEVRVVDGATGIPVEEFAVRCAGRQSHEIREDGRHEHGILRLPMPAGRLELMVFPISDHYLPSAEILIDKPRGEDVQVTVPVYRPVPLMVHVRFPDARPAAGTSVQLIHLHQFYAEQLPRTLDATSIAYPPREMYGVHDNQGDAWLVAQGTTDIEGQVVLQAPPFAIPATLCARGPDHAPVVRGDVQVTPNMPPILVTVVGGAGMRVVVRGVSEERPASSLRFGLVAENGRTELPPPWEDTWRPDREGVLEREHLPEGRWVLLFSDSGMSHDGQLASLDLRDGVTTEWVVHLDDLRPATLAGMLNMDSEPVSGCKVRLRRGMKVRTGVVFRGYSRETETDGQGRFRIEGLAPGLYHLLLQRPGTTNSSADIRMDAMPVGDWFELTPGQDLDHTFAFRSARVSLRITGPDGRPWAERTVRLRSDDGCYTQLQTDTDGRVTVDPSPTGELTVIVNPDEWSAVRGAKTWAQWTAQEVHLGPILVRPGDRDQELALQVAR